MGHISELRFFNMKQCTSQVLAVQFSNLEIPNTDEAPAARQSILPTVDAIYNLLVHCPKPPSSPPTNVDGVAQAAKGLTAQPYRARNTRVSWRPWGDGWLIAEVNGSIPWKYDSGGLIRLYLSSRRSFYEKWISRTVVGMARQGLNVRTKVNARPPRWDVYDGITVYLLPGELQRVLTFLWGLNPAVFVDPPTFKTARQVTWQGVARPVFLAQEPDTADVSFHERLSFLLVAAIEQAVGQGAMTVAAKRWLRLGEVQSWQLATTSFTRWAEILHATLGDGGVNPNAVYLNKAIHSGVRQAVAAALGPF